jgi:ABC-type multidrug transport system fused ATPase/permease subunit
MISLETALLVFLAIAVSIFSLVYSFVDNHTSQDIRKDLFRNIRTYVLGLVACGICTNIIQGLWGT